ncbi:hypothetical protein GCM10023184_06070 [Flaviaesturariibacter amylovorans]|uniref:Serpin domain-containing protein n=1 Tax=Flaviaesturariibacter amylovorans TaxID=1084520 RepID=A0ABP8GAR0_9BACT
MLALLLFISCDRTRVAGSRKLPKGFPSERTAADFPKTQFLATLEEAPSAGRNTVYTPTLLYAWNGVAQELRGGIAPRPGSSPAFRALTASKGHYGAMEESEYAVETTVEGEAVSVRAFFHKALDFPVLLQKAPGGLSFGGRAVAAFGMKDYEGAITRFVEILYYKDDDHFALRLRPQQHDQEIVLAKGLPRAPSLLALLRELDTAIAKGRELQKVTAHQWRYRWETTDRFLVPEFAFHIRAEFPSLLGQRFASSAGPKRIEEAWQRNAFVLNERGAIAESEGSIGVTADTVVAPEVKPQPKNFILDKPFLLLLRHNEKRPPYFVIDLQHPELLRSLNIKQ